MRGISTGYVRPGRLDCLLNLNHIGFCVVMPVSNRTEKARNRRPLWENAPRFGEEKNLRVTIPGLAYHGESPAISRHFEGAPLAFVGIFKQSRWGKTLTGGFSARHGRGFYIAAFIFPRLNPMMIHQGGRRPCE